MKPKADFHSRRDGKTGFALFGMEIRSSLNGPGSDKPTHLGCSHETMTV